jgi:DNA polymerase-3 subunit gamma/tau
MYISLYRKYRPQTFSDMVGQSAAVRVLKESLREGRLGHAYLFSGPRGCGKTSAARLVAKTLNCENLTDAHEPCGKCQSCVATALGEHLDVIEIDGASNRGVGEIRDLKSHVNLKPLASKNKVYIIDEVHMLTEQAFNALLKTLEEPPANVYFLLATTEPHKVPVTIRSRCQHIPFHRISMEDMICRIEHICKEENITADRDAVWEVARSADGALRDALSFMEQAIALGGGKLTIESVSGLMGGSNRAELEKWVRNLRIAPEDAAKDLSGMLSRGVSPERFTELIFALLRDLWIYSSWGDRGLEALDASQTELEFLKEESKFWDREKLDGLCLFCGELLPRTRYGMRLEVFSGLIMVNFLGILEGKKRTETGLRETPSSEARQNARPHYGAAPSGGGQHRAAARQFGRAPVFDDKGSDDTATPQRQAPRREAPSSQAKRAQEELKPSEEVKLDGDLGKILSELGPFALTFGAALLNTKILKDGESWAFDFGKGESPAQAFLTIPRNKRALASALNKIWDVKPPEDTLFSGEDEEEGPESDTAPQPEPAPSAKSVRPATEESRNIGAESLGRDGGGSSGTARDRILRLMGAEILYVKESARDEGNDNE